MIIISCYQANRDKLINQIKIQKILVLKLSLFVLDILPFENGSKKLIFIIKMIDLYHKHICDFYSYILNFTLNLKEEGQYLVLIEDSSFKQSNRSSFSILSIEY